MTGLFGTGNSAAPAWHGGCISGVEPEFITTMKFTLEIGHTEKSLVEYEFNQLLGSLSIRVNNESVRNSVRLFNEPKREVFDFEVGQNERAKVRIEKERGAFIVQKNRVFVDNRLAGVFQGY
jgi:hypothetical protein